MSFFEIFCLKGTYRRYLYISVSIANKILRSYKTQEVKVFILFCLLMEGSGAGSGSVQINTDPGSGGPRSYKSYESGSRGTLRIRIYELGAWCAHTTSTGVNFWSKCKEFCEQALCSAVEQERLEKVRSILETQTHVNVNGVNGDGFTLLGITAGVIILWSKFFTFFILETEL